MHGKNERDFIATLRNHGLQVTYQRLAIYQALYNMKDHPSAEGIYQHVKKRFPMISLGTVYKTLERFYEVGLIQKVSPVTEVARYDANTRPHHHMVCLECQTILDIEDEIVQNAVHFPDASGFQVTRHHVVLQGYCDKCRKS